MNRPLVASLVLALLVGCSRRDTSPQDEAAARADDRRALGALVACDVRASQALREADEAARVGDGGAATSAIDALAAPAVEDGLRQAQSAAMKTAWGSARRDELVSVLRERKAAMPLYEEAVRDGDPSKMLEAVQAQSAIERRALAAVASIDEGR